MKIRLLILLLVGLLCQSCEYFKKAEHPDTIADQDIDNIDWTTVETYPLFEGCDELSSKALQKQCFEEVLLASIQTKLQTHQFIVNESINETIYLDFLVDTLGVLQILNVDASAKVRQQLPVLDSLIRRSIDSLPSLDPARKQNLYVQATFRVPMRIYVEP